MARYSVAFALPIGTDVSFSEDGWEFKSPAPLSLNVKSEFISKFNLELVECYSGVEKFSVDGPGVQDSADVATVRSCTVLFF